jgi:hypothetical protein
VVCDEPAGTVGEEYRDVSLKDMRLEVVADHRGVPRSVYEHRVAGVEPTALYDPQAARVLPPWPRLLPEAGLRRASLDPREELGPCVVLAVKGSCSLSSSARARLKATAPGRMYAASASLKASRSSPYQASLRRS